jgi:hypothetical protein
VKAAERIAGSDAPRVMLGLLRSADQRAAVQNFYQAEIAQQSRFEEISSNEDIQRPESMDLEEEESDEDSG